MSDDDNPSSMKSDCREGSCPYSARTSAIAFPMPRQRPLHPPKEYLNLPQDNSVVRATLWNGDEAWVVTRHHDYRMVMTDSRFSADPNRPGFPGQSAALHASRKRYPSFQTMDPPQHTEHRQMVAQDFSFKRVEELRPTLQRIIDEILDRMIDEGPPVDFVDRFAIAVPSAVICELLGAPHSDHDFFQSRTRVFTSNTASAEEALTAGRELVDEYLATLLKQKNQDPQDDLLSRVMVKHVRSGELTEHEVVSPARMLLVAGHETTANMISLGMLLLLQHPEQLALLRETPSLTPGAVEEIIRFTSIAHAGQRRVAIEDVEVAGQLIRAGDGIIAFNPAANRDASVFTNPDAFDITRDARRQVGFGFGRHACLGQPLARAELQIVFDTLLRRLPGLRLAAPTASLKFKDEMLVYGVETLPIVW
jgi:cytochrome P450